MVASRGEAGSRIVLDGTLNLRDLGGWVTSSGIPTVYGRLYRSDRLSNLSDRDHRILESRRIATVVDLRRDHEVAEHPSKLWSTVRAVHQIPMGGHLSRQVSLAELILAGELGPITEADVAASYVELLNTQASSLARAIEALLSGDPALFHCTAGKDRTGVLSMLILWTVGVNRNDVLLDFELSNEYRTERRIAELRPGFAAAGVDIDAYRAALSAPRSALDHAMTWLTREYGGAEGYLTEAAGLTEPGSRLRQLLLDPAPG